MLLVLLLPGWISKLFRSNPYQNARFEQLRRGCMDGNPQAYQAFISRYERLVWHTVLQELSHASQEDQEEVVANTFFSLLSQNASLLSRYVSTLGLSPESYIRRQAHFQVQNRRRSLQSLALQHTSPLAPPHTQDGVLDTTPSQLPTAEEQLLEQQQLRGLIAQLESRLSPAIMLTFQLLYEEERSPAEVAKALGISLDLVYARKKRIADTLQVLLKSTSPEGSLP